MKRKTLPFELNIAKPCDQSWSSMTGNAHQRHCDSCNKQVHNLAALTPSQIERLLHHSDGHLCARITRRQDGSLSTLSDEELSPLLLNLALFSAIALTPAVALAQAQPASGTSSSPQTNAAPAPVTVHTAVGGVITDPQGALVVGANVTLRLNGVALGTAHTNEVGKFEFAVAPGNYDLEVASTGFVPYSKSLTVTDTTAVISDLTIKPGTETIVQVTAIQLDSGSTMGTMVAYYGPWYKRLGYHLRHPIVYTRYLLHRY